jgi:phosphotransferase system IIB component
MQTEHYLIGALAFIILIVFVLFVVSKRKQKKTAHVPSFLQLYEALGKSENILSLSREHDRLRVRVRDKTNIDQALLKELGIPAIAAQGEIKLLIRKHSQEALSYLDEKRKEET